MNRGTLPPSAVVGGIQVEKPYYLCKEKLRDNIE